MEKLKTIEIKGKEYVMVKDRITHFRTAYPEYSLTSEILKLEEGFVVIKATVSDKTGRILATGHAYEKEGKGNINRDSYIENCETSAIGRCLGIFGIGIDTSIASADEMDNIVELPKTETQNRFLDAVKRLESADAVYSAIDMSLDEVKQIFAKGTAEDYERLNDALFELEAK